MHADRSPVTVLFKSLILEDTRFDEFLKERLEIGSFLPPQARKTLVYHFLYSESNATNIATASVHS